MSNSLKALVWILFGIGISYLGMYGTPLLWKWVKEESDVSG